MTTWPTVSVIVAARNAASTIEAQLAAIDSQTYPGPWNLITVDDASTDTTTDRIRCASSSDRLTLITLNQRVGQASARNRGAEHSSAEVLAFTDGDDVVHPRWLQHLVEALAGADLVGGSIDDCRLNSDKVRRRRPPHPNGRLPTDIEGRPYALGTNLAIWRTKFDQLGGWTDRMIAGTDVDLCRRAHAAGMTLAYARPAVVSYRIPTSRRRLVAQNYRWGQADAQTRRSLPGPPQASGRTKSAVRRILTGHDSALRLLAYTAGRISTAQPSL